MIQIVLILITLISHVNSQTRWKQADQVEQTVPEACRLNELMMFHCCVHPPFFNRDTARECGARIKIYNMFPNDVAGMRRLILTGCDYWTCVLVKYDMLTQSRQVDDEKYFKHLEKWVDLNPDFADAMLNAKIHCKMTYRPIIPLKLCEFSEFNGCIRNYIRLNCPQIFETEDCKKQKEFLDNCKEYYY